MRTFSVPGACMLLILLCIRIIGCLNHQLSETYLYKPEYKGSAVMYDKTPERYYANSHVSSDVEVTEGEYHISFQFKGHKKTDREVTWTYNEQPTDKDILRFGVPKSMFDPYYPIDSVIQKRNAQMKAGMFEQEGRYLRPSLPVMVNYYKPYLQPIARSLADFLGESGTFRERIELLIKFCQDIPYGIPPKQIGNKYIGGVFPPPQVFINMFGDCDSKAVIFCSAASHYNKTDIILLYETGHVMPAVKGLPRPYDNFYTYKNEKYILAETSGPGRSNLGMVKDPYRNFKRVEHIEIN